MRHIHQHRDSVIIGDYYSECSANESKCNLRVTHGNHRQRTSSSHKQRKAANSQSSLPIQYHSMYAVSVLYHFVIIFGDNIKCLDISRPLSNLALYQLSHTHKFC